MFTDLALGDPECQAHGSNLPVRIDRERGQIYFKLTYFGPGFAGKQTSLRYIWNRMRLKYKTAFQNVLPGDELGSFSLEELKKTEQSRHGRQVWFELTPATLAPIAGLRVKLDLQANSGALWCPATRRLSLDGADGVMFVADSNVVRNDANLDTLKALVSEVLRPWQEDPGQPAAG